CFEKEFNVWEACWNDRQSEIDQLKRKLETANFFKKGDDHTIENSTSVISEMRNQIQKLQNECNQLKSDKEQVINLAEKWMAMVNGDFGLTERLTAYNYGSELMRIFKKPNSKNIGG